eukprot:TRINITY_DN91384_c0_g1_i1.p1 TRINITY_DN91384_c0_g1~~TRINITY_DN91384_c0_g1_i1.p1  ORF type:complete len:328 (+),score=57.01 TRINITY_DN91384_c0_g1_i1:167-1150(+)
MAERSIRASLFLEDTIPEDEAATKGEQAAAGLPDDIGLPPCLQTLYRKVKAPLATWLQIDGKRYEPTMKDLILQMETENMQAGGQTRLQAADKALSKNSSKPTALTLSMQRGLIYQDVLDKRKQKVNARIVTDPTSPPLKAWSPQGLMMGDDQRRKRQSVANPDDFRQIDVTEEDVDAAYTDAQKLLRSRTQRLATLEIPGTQRSQRSSLQQPQGAQHSSLLGTTRSQRSSEAGPVHFHLEEAGRAQTSDGRRRPRPRPQALDDLAPRTSTAPAALRRPQADPISPISGGSWGELAAAEFSPKRWNDRNAQVLKRQATAPAIGRWAV